MNLSYVPLLAGIVIGVIFTVITKASNKNEVNWKIIFAEVAGVLGYGMGLAFVGVLVGKVEVNLLKIFLELAVVTVLMIPAGFAQEYIKTRKMKSLAILLAVVVLLAMPVTAVEVRGKVASQVAMPDAFNLANASAGEVIWTPQSFAGFYYNINDNTGKERLQVLQPDLSEKQRAIGENNLVYSTGAEPKMLKVVKEAFNSSVTNATKAGLERASAGQAFENGSYYVMGWQTLRYVPINGKIGKFSKLLFEHGTDVKEKKTLTAGETWNLGDGWTLVAQSIDAKTTPRQAWLVLSKDGVRVDDKVISEKKVYTYVEKNIANESDVPLFVTFVDSVFSGANSDMVQLRFTWVVSPKVTTIKTGDTFGVFKVTELDTTAKRLVLKNKDKSIALSQNSVAGLMGDIKFRVADSATLRFYPITVKDVSMTATATPTTTATATPAATATIAPTTIPIQTIMPAVMTPTPTAPVKTPQTYTLPIVVLALLAGIVIGGGCCVLFLKG